MKLKHNENIMIKLTEIHLQYYVQRIQKSKKTSRNSKYMINIKDKCIINILLNLKKDLLLDMINRDNKQNEEIIKELKMLANLIYQRIYLSDHYFPNNFYRNHLRIIFNIKKWDLKRKEI